MEYRYRYWAWTTDFRGNELNLKKDLEMWDCQYEISGDCVNIWIPEKSLILVLLKYRGLRPHPVFDLY